MQRRDFLLGATAATLARLAMLIERYAPRLVIALGDSFHDGGGPARMSDISRAVLKAHATARSRDYFERSSRYRARDKF